MTSTNKVVANAVAGRAARNAEVAVNHKDGYNDIIQAFNKLTEGYFTSSRALKSVPDAYSAIKPALDTVSRNIGTLHDALKKWDAE